MKPRRIFSAARLSLPFASALVALFSAHSAQGQTTRYWDGNDGAANFGSASGTWAAPTTGTATAGWSSSSAGTTVVLANSVTTLINDPLNFGTDTTSRGLGTGTITVSGTVNAASLRFGSQTTGNITLSGGTINLAAVTTIHIGAGSTTVHTISSAITGAGTSLTKTGNSLTLSGANTYVGSTIISSGTLTLGTTGALGTTPGVSGTSGVTIGGAAAATLSSATTGITIAAPITSANTGINSTISFGRSTAAAGSLTLNGAIGGNGNVVFTTPNNNSGGNLQTVNLGATATYAGNTTITTGNANNATSVRNLSGAANVLPITTVLTMAGGAGAGTGRAVTFDLAGQNQELAGLTNTSPVPSLRNHRVTSGAAATLTINNATDFSYGGVASDGTTAQITGAIALTKKGAGKFTLAAGAGNAFTGATTILGGILNLGHPTSIQSSPFDTTANIAGDATNGLQTALTTLTLGGLSGSNSFASRFTTTAGGYTGLTALTLNPAFGVTQTYAADIGDGAGGMNLIKSGGGTQLFTVPQTHTGTTSSTNGVLIAPAATILPGYNVAGKLIFNGGTIGVQVGGAGWTTGEVDTLLANATKTSGALGIDTTNGNFTQWTPFTTTNFGPPLGLTKLGANDLTLDQPNTFVGSTTVSQGTLTLANPLALQNSPLITTAAGTLILSGVTTLNLGGLNGATGDLGTIISSGYSGLTALILNTPPTLPGSAITYSGNISEGALGMTLTKTGVGTQVLADTNSYTGATQIDNGTLVFRNKAAKAPGTATAAAAGSIGLGVKAADAAFYSAAEFGDLFNTNTLSGFSLDPASGVTIDTTAGSFDQTVVLTGTRSLTKLGANTLTFSTANSYSGTTSLTNGTLSLTHNDALGTTAGATNILGGNGTTGNTLSLSFATADLTIAENFNFTGNTVGRSQLSHSALSRFHTLTGAIDVTSDTNLVQFSVNAATGSTDLATVGGVTITGDITGALTNGAGFLLRGATVGGLSAINSMTGNITLTGAGLVKTDANTWTIGAAGKTYTAPYISASNGILKMGVADYITASAPELLMGNSSGASSGIFDLNGFNQTVKGITYNGGAGSTGTKTITNSDIVNAAVLTVNNSTDFSPTGGTVANSVVLTGNLGLNKQGASILTLSGLNTYTGNTVVNAGTLALADNAQLKFVLGASSGTSNSLTGAGTVTLDGDFAIDTTAADALAAGSWLLESVDTLTGPHGTTFSVVGFTDAGGNKWTKPNGLTKLYTFDETTGILKLETLGYASWASLNIGSLQSIDLDHDGDGVQNGVEYFLGGPTGTTTGFTPLPGVTNTLGVLSVTWIKGSGYQGVYGTDFTVETSSTLTGVWATADPGTAAGQADITTTPGQVKYTFPPGTRNFVRLKVTGP